jgi:RHS repeat-associated protein
LFDGQYTSADTGLIYLRARVYDPATAQFLTVDPIANLTRAPYNYASDNPLNYTDRTGLCSIVPGSSENCFSEVSGAIISGIESVAQNPVQAGGVVLGGVAVASGVGEVVAGGTVVAEGTLGGISAVSGFVGAGLDAKGCASGSGISCVGAGVGAVASGGAAAVASEAITGATAAGATAISLTAGGIGFLSDVASALASFDGNNLAASGCR